MATCPKCNGKKTIVLHGLFESDCDACKGTGEVGVASCTTCNDSKTVIQPMAEGLGVEVDCPDCSSDDASATT